ncbi:MAG: iron ABC transporter permease [Defluviitaleaceae bacterium]|nr:iron ABC transporter permease [Defluviitaleaceae bacterium]
MILLLLLSFLSIILGIVLGSVNISISNIFSGNEMTNAIIWDIRTPRVLMAYIAGAGLSISGVIVQSVLKNPLASSFTIGTASGAAVGASIAITLSLTTLGVFIIPFFGFSFAFLAILLSLTIANVLGNMQNISIVLFGMAISFFANSILTILLVFNSESMQRLIFWQMGSFAGHHYLNILIVFVPVLICSVFAFSKHKELDILTLDDVAAMGIGVDVRRYKYIFLIVSSVLTGLIVSFVGIIGFVDLFSPHLARKFFGASHKKTIIASALIGGSIMVLSDLIARTVFSPVELPVGAVTAFIGGPVFIYIFSSLRKAD